MRYTEMQCCDAVRHWRTVSDLAPEITRFTQNGLVDDKGSMHNILRPETTPSCRWLGNSWKLHRNIVTTCHIDSYIVSILEHGNMAKVTHSSVWPLSNSHIVTWICQNGARGKHTIPSRSAVVVICHFCHSGLRVCFSCGGAGLKGL